MKSELKKIANYFENLPPGLIDQEVGGHTPNRPCCVGSHLAHFLGGKTSFRYGIKAFCGVIGANQAQAILMLREAGAPARPFGGKKWPKPPAEVFAALTKIEELPSLVGADLTSENLAGANLKGANLRCINLVGANLRGADLAGANLAGANLERADLKGANLEGANLKGADLRGANLKDANVKNTILDKGVKNEQ